MLKNNIGYILDDHILFAEAFAKLLETYANFSRVHTYTNSSSLIQDLLVEPNQKNAFVFLDFYLGETLLPSILQDILRVTKNSKVIIISGISNPLLLHDLVKLKIDGIVHKSDSTCEIVKCINEVSLDNTYYTNYIREILSFTKKECLHNPFSKREIELILQFSKGLSVEETASALNLSPFTVATHRKRMFKKVDCNNISSLLAFARKIEII